MRGSRAGVKPHGGARRRLPFVALALVPACLFASISFGLRVPSVLRPELGLPGALDYSWGAVPRLSPLRAQFIRGVLGGVLPAPGTGSARAPIASAEPPRFPVSTVVTHRLTNDDFGKAYRFDTVPFTARTQTSSASREPSEPSCSPVGGRSVWYRFDAPADLALIADTFGADHALSLGVFRGSTMTQLQQMGCSTSTSGNAHVPFRAAAGATYYFQVDSVSGGNLVFDLRLQGVTRRFLDDGRFAWIWGNTSNDGRYWPLSGLELGAHPTQGCVGSGGGLPLLPGYCRIQAYVLDAKTNELSLVSVNDEGVEANDATLATGVSAGGRYVVFSSMATNLVEGDTNTCWIYRMPGQCFDGFIHDRDTDADGIFDEPGARKTIRITVPMHRGGDREGNDLSLAYGLSADGRFVGVMSLADNLVPGDENGIGDVFMHDRDADEDGIFDEVETGARAMIRITVSSTGRGAEAWSPPGAAATLERRDQVPWERAAIPLGISSNGRYSVFRSRSSNLVPNDTNDAYDVFVHDIVTRRTTRVNVSSNGEQANRGSRLHNAFARPVSDDGRYVLFVSDATNLVPGGEGSEHIYRRDLVRGITERITVTEDGDPAIEPPTPAQDVAWGGAATIASVFVYSAQVYTTSELNHAMSANGRYIYFSSGAKLLDEDENNTRDVYVRDMDRRTLALISVATSGEQANASSTLPWPSPDGRYVGFQSSATNLTEDAGVPEAASGFVWAPFIRVLPPLP